MKHIFVLNPKAGNGRGVKLLPGILSAAQAAEIEYEIHRTVSAGDARNYVAATLEEYGDSGDTGGLRFYACGGDGTMNEVLNGLMSVDAPGVEMASIPAGTGNDFIRNFDEPKAFANVLKQISGTAKPIDLLKYEISFEDEDSFHTDKGTETVETGPDSHVRETTSGYALNMINMGFDAEVVAKTDSIKTGPLSGSSAYIAGVLSTLIKLGKLRLNVALDGDRNFSDEYLLAGAANGSYSGGGFKGLPEARVDDGFMDVLLVKKISRRFFLSVVKAYHDGVYMEEPRLNEVMFTYKCKSAKFAPASDMMIAVDGETLRVKHLKVDIMPGAVYFVLPIHERDSQDSILKG